MKAKDYVEKYKVEMFSDNAERVTKAASELIFDLLKEVKTIMSIRNAKSNAALFSVLKEVNQKYNAICKTFPMLKRDGFKAVVNDLFPLIRGEW
jgi:hypothetical protein